MFVASYDGMVELDSEFGDPMFCPGRGDNVLEPMEIKGHKHAHVFTKPGNLHRLYGNYRFGAA